MDTLRCLWIRHCVLHLVRSAWAFVGTIAVHDRDAVPKDEVSSTTYTLGILFAVSGGLAAGFIWAPWGLYMSGTVEAIMENSDLSRTDVTADLTTVFGIVYLVLELACSLIASPLQLVGVNDVWLFVIYAIITTVTALLYPLTHNLPNAATEHRTWHKKLAITLSLWSDARLWLFGIFTVVFAVSAAYVGGVINDKATKAPEFKSTDKDMKSPYIGYFDSIVTAVAALAAWLCGVLVKKSRHGQLLGLSFGAFGFFLVAVFSIIVALCGKDLVDVGYALILPYVFQGIGRGAYESVNKAVFLDYFPTQQESAFSNQMCFFLVSNGIFFLIIRPYSTSGDMFVIPDAVRYYLILGLSLIAVPSYVLGVRLSRKELLGNLGGDASKDGAIEDESEELGIKSI